MGEDALSQRVGSALSKGGAAVLHYAGGQLGAVKVIGKEIVDNNPRAIREAIERARTPGFHGNIRVESAGDGKVYVIREESIGKQLLME